MYLNWNPRLDKQNISKRQGFQDVFYLKQEFINRTLNHKTILGNKEVKKILLP